LQRSGWRKIPSIATCGSLSTPLIDEVKDLKLKCSIRDRPIESIFAVTFSGDGDGGAVSGHAGFIGLTCHSAQGGTAATVMAIKIRMGAEAAAIASVGRASAV